MIGGLARDWVGQRLVLEVRAAEAAAQAARAVPGVVRLQPGVFGLLGQLAARAWERATGRGLPDIGGVRAELDDRRTEDPTLRVDLQLVVDGGYQAAAVAADVQLAVPAAVTDAVGVLVTVVLVHVVEIDLSAG